MVKEEEILIVASRVRNPISGRFKVLRNWAKGLNSRLVVTNSSFEHSDLTAVSNGVEIDIIEIEEIGEALQSYNPRYVFTDDRDFNIVRKFKDRRIISYIYPIHGLWGMPGLSAANIVGWQDRLKVWTYRRLPHINLRSRYRQLESVSSLVIAQSNNAAGILRYYYGINPSLVLYNPVDRTLFKPLHSIEDKMNSNEITIFLGSNNGDTDLKLIKSVARAAKRSGFTLNMFGYEKNLQYAIDIYENSHYFKKVTDQKLAEILSRSRLVVLPQLDEPASYVGIEAISCGTPVMSNYVDESIIVGTTGYVANGEAFINIFDRLNKNGIDREIYENTSLHAVNFDTERESKVLRSYLKKMDGDVSS